MVELAAYCNEEDEKTFRTFCDANSSKLTSPDYHLPEMRLAQQSALALPNVFIAAAMDLGSLHPLPYESIHPVNKQEIARRIGLALRAVGGDATSLYRGPRRPRATLDKSGSVTLEYVSVRHPPARSLAPSFPSAIKLTRKVDLRFELQPGAGGLALNVTAGCPSVVLDVYCRRDQTLGFEVMAGGVWSPPGSVELGRDGKSLWLAPAAADGLPGGGSQIGAITAVRYAYSDWPVTSLRNAAGGLPAELFVVHT